MARDVVLFDGVCALCDASVRFLLARDTARRLSYAPLQGETAREVIERHPGVDGTLSTVVYVREMGTENERLYERSDAAVEILRDLGGMWRTFAVLGWVPRPLRNAVYDWIARHRYRWFGRFDACRLPEPNSSDRFLP